MSEPSTGAGLGLDFLYSRCPAPNGVGTSEHHGSPREIYASNPRLPGMRHSQADIESIADSSRSISTAQSFHSGTADNEQEGPGCVGAVQQPLLSRHGTLLSVNATPGRNAAELKTILGSSNARLKPGAALLPIPGHFSNGEDRTSLEQAKSRARVEVDIILDRKIYVQGGYLQGHVKIRIQKSSKNDAPVMISGGKVRVVGFESITSEHDRYPFYQCSSPLSTVTATSGSLYESHPDEEGFALAIEGEYTLPFSMYLPMSADYGLPKGALQIQSGVAVRYIAMVQVFFGGVGRLLETDVSYLRSIKVKDSISDSRSIAHFYRNCEIWPRLNPSAILLPAEKPLQAATTKSLFMGGSGKVELTASVHRLHWIAGQQCFVKVSVDNASKKTIKSLALALIRSTVVFKPDHRLDAFGDMDPDACQTSTTQKQVAESVLEMGQRSARGHASAKGWWTGVPPGHQLEFSHSILLPLDALSVTRSRLLEVEYSLRVTLSAGALHTANIQTSLPVRIVNFLSVDPPPSFPLPGASSEQSTMQHLHELADARPEKPYVRPPRFYHPRSRGISGPYRSNSTALESLAEADEERLPSPGQALQKNNSQNDSLAPEDAYEGNNYDSDCSDIGEHDIDASTSDDLGDMTIYEDDADEIVPHIVRVDPEYENAPRFADLYHASVQGLCQSACAQDNERHQVQCQTTSEASFQGSALMKQKSQVYEVDLRPGNSRPPITWTRPIRPHGPSSFAQRVHIKMEAAAAALTSQASLDDASLSCAHDMVPVSSSQLAFKDHGLISMHGYPKDHPTQESIHPSEILQNQGSGHDPTAIMFPQTTATLTQSHPGEPICLPVLISEHPASLPYKQSSGFSDVSSGALQILPRPPSMITSQVPPAPTGVTFTVPHTTPPSCIPRPRDNYNDPGPYQYSQRQPDTRRRPDFLEAVPGNDSRPDVGSRPSILALKEHAGGSIGESSNSVKERIRELEERQRWLELNEP
ncbi:hypothetical protein D9615_001281 [Tricholomella constricta]|uniref:Arrestin C-terminal-like domain-containing protein n=1 Tax=Tricholomella constricta TaxID=117010 RepID=A0A8H5M941_9AGAR|nr:hypothetical protein D9615_001281 [Tricholomella constricta]